jgi:SAM-dependent methyltransferase
MSLANLPDRVRKRLDATRKDRRLIAAARDFDAAVALEPGGPSALLAADGLVPVYPQLAALDTLDYAERTIWSEAAEALPGAIGIRRQVIAEAGSLDQVPDGSYDALLASHVLEHLANPLGALREWTRVVRPGGHVLLIVPHRDGTFDHRRPVTTLAHLRSDAERRTPEDDLSHLPEILSLHDLERDPGAPDRETFEQRCRENPATRAMHHHVFVTRSVAEVCAEVGLEVVLLRPKQPFNIVCVCRVGTGARGPSEQELAKNLRRSTFPSDRARAA